MSAAELTARVQAALDAWARSRLHSHYGDVTIDSVSADGDVRLRFLGACTSCPLRPMTFVSTILPVLENVPDVRSVEVLGLLLSESAIQRTRSVLASQERNGATPRAS